MNTKKILFTLFLSAALLTGCGYKNKDKDIIIKVNNDPITQTQFDESFKLITNNKIQDKENPLYLIIKDRVVNELVVRKLLEQEIEHRKITVTEQEEQESLKKIISKYGSQEKLDQVLAQSGISKEKFKNDLISEIKMQKLIKLLGKVDVSNSEVKNFYKNNPEKFETPERVRASHILISANPKEIEKYLLTDKENKALTKEELNKKIQEEINTQKSKAEKILSEVKRNPKGFDQYAKKYSEDIASGQNGGDLGFFAYEDMVEPFSKAAFSLKPNKVSNLVQTDYGFHIIMVKDRAKAGKITFDKAKEDIKQYLYVEKQVKLLEGLITNLKNNAKIEFINPEYKPEKIEKGLTQEVQK